MQFELSLCFRHSCGKHKTRGWNLERTGERPELRLSQPEAGGVVVCLSSHASSKIATQKGISIGVVGSFDSFCVKNTRNT